MKIFKRKKQNDCVDLMNLIIEARQTFPNDYILGKVIRTFTYQVDKLNIVDPDHFSKVFSETIDYYKQNANRSI